MAMPRRPTDKDTTMNASTRDWRGHLPDGSRSVQSVWIWRGFFFMSLLAFGVAISLTSQQLRFYAVAWYVIAAGWFAISMRLWRKHVRDDDAAWEELQRSKGSRPGSTGKGRRR